MNLLKKLRDIKIKIQMWNFRRKYKSGAKIDLEMQLKAIQKADILSQKRKCRLWVLRIMPGKYRIGTKADIKVILRSIGMHHTIDMYKIGNEIVHITK
jgi:hypothetical protein